MRVLILLSPGDMLDDYSIKLHAKKRKKPPQKILLDSNYMHSAIDRHYPGESNRRGRPDIVYHLLVCCHGNNCPIRKEF